MSRLISQRDADAPVHDQAEGLRALVRNSKLASELALKEGTGSALKKRGLPPFLLRRVSDPERKEINRGPVKRLRVS